MEVWVIGILLSIKKIDVNLDVSNHTDNNTWG
jgi:hypothetical protein